MPDRAAAAARRRALVPRSAYAASSWGSSEDDVDDALRVNNEQEEKKRHHRQHLLQQQQQQQNVAWRTTTATTTAIADSEPADDDNVDSEGAQLPSLRQQEANPMYVYRNEYPYQQRETAIATPIAIASTDHAGGHRTSSSHGQFRPTDTDTDTDTQPVNAMHRGDVDVDSRGDRHHDNDSNDNDSNINAHWPCPRCTLQNPTATTKCVACNFKQRTTTTTTSATAGIHPQDPVRSERHLPHHHHMQQRFRDHRSRNRHRNRLLAALERDLELELERELQSDRSIASQAAATSTFAPSFQQSQQQQPGLYHTAAHFIVSGALLGGLLGVAGAHLLGENSHVYWYPYSYAGITSYSTFWAVVLEIALTGAIGGAVVHNVLEQERAIRRARLHSTHSNDSSSNNDNNMSQDDTDDPTVAFIMRSMETSSRLSSRQMAQAMGVDGNGSSSSSMSSYDYYLNSIAGGGGNGGSESNYDSEIRAAGEQDIHSLPSVQIVQADTDDPDKLPEDCRRCAICLDTFAPGSFRKTLPCWHGFHTQCVDKWLRTVGACPICKHRIDG
jgi:hypothetical protein